MNFKWLENIFAAISTFFSGKKAAAPAVSAPVIPPPVVETPKPVPPPPPVAKPVTPTPAPPFEVAIPMQRGSRGPDIEIVQRVLNRLGYYNNGGKFDESFGPIMDAAVRAFQKSQGLVQNGIVDVTTLHKMGGKPRMVESDNSNESVLPAEPDRPDATDRVLLWYPDKIDTNVRQRGAGKYRKGYPEGMVVHWVWAPQKNNAEFWLAWGRDQNYAFFTMGADGSVAQGLALDEWNSHAGTSSWPSVGSSVSSKFVGIEVICEGKVTKYADGTFGNGPSRKVPSSQIRYIEKKKDNMQAGYYQKFTPAQEKSLTKLILWLKWNNPSVFSLDNVVGHDEVAPTRKSDPGGSLSLSMPEYRKYLKEQYALMVAKYGERK